MRRGPIHAPLLPRPAAAPALLALLALAGCGSSGSSHPTASTAATSGTGSAASSSGASSLKVTGTPKFATPSSSQPVQSGTVQIAYRNITISPDTLRVRVGTTIRWTNLDSVEHNVTSQSGPQRFASQNFGEGRSFTLTLTKPGLLHYLCTIHPATMNGAIEVLR
jgi:plastocyanin